MFKKTLLAPNVYESKKYKTMNYATSGCLRELLLYGGIFCIGDNITISSYLLEESQ